MHTNERKTEIVTRACRIMGIDYSNSEALGISPQTLAKWQKGICTPSETRLYDLLETFCILADHVVEESERMWQDTQCRAVLFPRGFPQIPHRTDTKRKYRGKHGMDKRTAHARIEFLKKLQAVGIRPTVEFMAGFQLEAPDGSRKGAWKIMPGGKTASGHDELGQAWIEGDETQGEMEKNYYGGISAVYLTPLPTNPTGSGCGMWQYNEPGKKPYAVWKPDNSTEAISEVVGDLLKHIREAHRCRRKEAEEDAEAVIIEDVVQGAGDGSER